ncbi:hypothetical protein [Agrobacterium sp.]|uniref:hypothetical protein n=1 Tax=Agrobacterium sp. TaxID=361 RepID=UPI0040346046
MAAVIGKEKILFAVHRSTGLRLYVDETKWGVLSCLGYSAQLMRDTFTTDPGEAAAAVHGQLSTRLLGSELG